MQPTRRPNLSAYRKMTETEQLIYKYSHYLDDGRLVFSITLSANVTDDRFAASQGMRSFFERHFLRQIDRHLPYKLKGKYDFDYVIEKSPGGHWHFHGLLAFPVEAGKYLWRDNTLNKHLCRDLDSMRSLGEIRPFALISHQIEPIREGEEGIRNWSRYITKTSNFIPSSSPSWHDSKIALGISGSILAWMPSSRHSARRLRQMRRK